MEEKNNDNIKEISKEDISIEDFHSDEENLNIIIGIRAVIKIGSSHSVTLPFKWVKKNKIDKKVFIETRGDVMIITPFRK